MSNLKISIATEFLGKGIKDANKGVKGLEGSVKNLGYMLGGGYIGAKVIAFGKSSVKAFMEDQQAVEQLTNTMKNLGLELSAPAMDKFIENLTQASGIVDDKLRPAMQALLTTTGSYAASQKILTQSLDVAAATGSDVTQVANDLAQAYVGNLKGLRKYNLGLTQAELKASSFEQIMTLLNQKFAGAEATRLDSYAGKMQLIATRAGEAKEIIGKGLVDAFIKLGGSSNNIDKATDKMTNLAKVARGVVNTFADVIWAVTNPKGYLQESLATKSWMSPTVSSAIQQGAAMDILIADKKALDVQKKRSAELAKQLALQKAQAAEAKKKLVLDQASAVLNKAQQLFENDRIQLAAAMQGKLTEEDKVRIKLKQDILDLENAINEGNVVGAAKFAQAIVTDADLLNKLRGSMIDLNGVQNPFDAWLETIKAMAAELAKLAQIPVMSIGSTHVGGTGLADWGAASYELPTNPYGTGSYYGATGRDMPSNLVVQIGNKEINDYIVQTVNTASSNGTQLSYTQTAVR